MDRVFDALLSTYSSGTPGKLAVIVLLIFTLVALAFLLRPAARWYFGANCQCGELLKTGQLLIAPEGERIASTLEETEDHVEIRRPSTLAYDAPMARVPGNAFTRAFEHPDAPQDPELHELREPQRASGAHRGPLSTRARDLDDSAAHAVAASHSHQARAMAERDQPPGAA